MKHFTLQDVLAATGGTWHGDPALLSRPLTGVDIDSRRIREGMLFVAIVGERLDGHEYAASSRAAGALASLVHKPVEEPYILVEDTLAAFQQVARAYRKLFSIPFVGVTGSAGKTSTKELLAAALSSRFRVHKTQGNLNNQTGVPLTLFGLEESHTAAIIEMGTNHPGEIDSLAAMALPDYCVITNIGEAHIEFFGTREGIFKGKTEMLAHMSPGGRAIVSADDDFLPRLKDSRQDVLTFGLAGTSDVRGENLVSHGLAGTAFRVDGEEYFVPSPGLHMVKNALAAVAVGRALGMTPEEIRTGLMTYAPVGGRMDIRQAGDFTVINDTYNANPRAMRSAIDVLDHAQGRRVCILGDMGELGAEAPQFHREVGEYAARKGIHLVIGIGTHARHLCDGARQTGCPAFWFETREQAQEELPRLLLPGDSILVKASRSMALEHVTQAICRMAEGKE